MVYALRLTGLIALLLLAASADAQSTIDRTKKPKSTDVAGVPSDSEVDAGREKSRRDFAFKLTCLAVGFGSLALIAEFARMCYMQETWSQHSYRLVIVTLVLTTGMFVLAAGWSDSQMAPLIGLLGTIVGYIFGQASTPSDHVQAIEEEMG